VFLGARLPDGTTRRDNLIAAAAASGREDERLGSEAPPEGSALWEAYLSLSATARPSGFAAAVPIPPSEIEAWCRLHRVSLTPWELDTLDAIDRAMIAAVKANKPEGPSA